jgi:hypothetical protein
MISAALTEGLWEVWTVWYLMEGVVAAEAIDTAALSTLSRQATIGICRSNKELQGPIL